MTDSVFALIGYILWTAALLISLIGYRSFIVVKGDKKANEFNPDGNDLGGFPQRLTRAYANCIESFPIVAGALIVCLMLERNEVSDPLAIYVLLARVLQSLVHLASVSIFAVQVRFVLFIFQIALSIYWLTSLVV